MHPKELHVSPFFGMDQTYRFFLSEPGERLYARIDVEQDGGRPFIATLTGHGRPLSDLALLRTLARNPLLSGRVTGLIHWQAVRLWLKGVPVFSQAAVRAGPGVGAMTLAARRTSALRELPRPSAGPLATVAERVILKGLGLMSLGGRPSSSRRGKMDCNACGTASAGSSRRPTHTSSGLWIVDHRRMESIALPAPELHLSFLLPAGPTLGQ